MKLGDYVRTDKGEIGKVTSVASENLGFGNMEFCNTEPYVYGDVIKSSSNIIDLIEEGDYVNGMIVHCVYVDNDEIVVGGLDILIQDTLVTLRSNNIKSIVTKEQFEGIEYKL